MQMKAHLFYRVAATPNVNLGRIRSIVERAVAGGDGQIKSFALLSPNRDNWDETLGVADQADSQEFSARTNDLMLQQLKADLKGMSCAGKPCGWRQGEGIGQEGPNNVVEPSFFVANISLMDARRLWKRYYQWGIVYSGPETKGKIILMGFNLKRGERFIQDLGAMWTFTNDKNKQMMEENRADFPNKSQFKGQDFVFARKATLFQRKVQ